MRAMLSIGFGSHLEFSCVNYNYGTYCTCFCNLVCVLQEVCIYYKLKRQCFSSSFSRCADAVPKECHFPVFLAAILNFWP